MNEDQFLLYDHQKPILLKAEKISFYLQGEIIEAFTENNEVYYLIFYKYQFLTAVKAIRLRRKSYIEDSFKKGMVFNAPHPFINGLLSSNAPLKIISFQPLIKKLDRLYTPQEKSFILTFFESFFPKKQLFEQINSVFFEYRRNGQMFLGYRIIRILMDFAPKHSLVKQLANDSMFNKYADLYNQKSEKLFAKDLIFAEKTLYAQKDNEECFQQLVALMEKESRWIDLSSLLIYKLSQTPSIDYYQLLLDQLEKHLSENETVQILEKLSNDLPSFLPLQKELFEKYVKNFKIEKVLNMMNSYHFQLNSSQVQALGDILDCVDSEGQSFQPEVLKDLLKSYIDFFPEKAEILLNKYVISLLKTHELDYIKEWLNPFMKNHQCLKIFEKIDTMKRLNEDLDQMQTLGELYVEFGQFEKAIECFSWEMELKPTNTKPLQWLSKIYREMGMNHEADAFRELCIDIQKWA
ncbi:hypothetical protein [Bacillus sp. 1NLA3E]|uniref:hypothetical protein n=1 Tax=Bacillus sp. 1NLA3E TaxID=666686 RepID=UPI000247EE89|nr:hypothetical protein [Bacillus sp. 1NLA3E]AGK54113.1 hypothetical protein B1NLA3E_11815 [Bacillus sp. 1NLA3E]